MHTKAINFERAFSKARNFFLTRVLIIAGFLAGIMPAAHAQTAQPDSIVQITAEAAGLARIDPTNFPTDSGSYWLVTSNGVMAPFPAPLFDSSFPVYEIVDGIYLVDATGGQVAVPPDQTDDAQIITGSGTSSAAQLAATDALGTAVADLIDQIQERQILRDTATMMGVDLNPGDGGDPGDGTITNNFVGSVFDTNQLWLEITNVSSGTAFANLHNGTNQVYAIWSTTDLTIPFSNWQVEAEIWPTDTNCHPFSVTMQNRDTLFLKAQDWTGVDSDGDGIPDWWAWKYFGVVNINATNQDFAGNGTFGDDYSNSVPPMVFQFSGIEVTNNYATSSPASVQLDVAGSPYYVAVLVDSEDFSNAVWNTFSSSNVTVNLGTDGWHEVWIGLRGHADDPDTGVWQWKRVKLDTTPPAIVITGPTNSTVDVPTIQLTGYSPETLASISYDLSNTNGFWTNQPVTLLDRYFDTNIWDFTTNTFQAYDVPLAAGLNTFTIYATDLAGNVTTTNFSFTVDYSAKIAPNVQIAWPQDGMQISGNSFTLVGQVDDPTATVYASITDTNGNTSIATGLVERNGRFWLENLPLNGGTNVLSVTVSNVVGQTNVTTLNLVQSPLNLTLTVYDPFYTTSESPLWQPTVNLRGNISDPNAAVWVNGVPGTNNGDGTWSANNVPVTPGGVAIFNVTAYPSGETPSGGGDGINPQSANSVNFLVEMDKPPRFYVANYSLVEIRNSDDLYEGDYNTDWALLDWGSAYDDWRTELNWTDQAGGAETMTENEAVLGTLWAIEDQNGVYQEWDTWPPSVWPTPTNGVQVSTNYGWTAYYNTNYSGGVSNNAFGFPNIPMEHCYLKGTLTASATFPSGSQTTVVRHHLTFFRKAQTVMKLQTGGKAGAGRQSLFQFTASALGGSLTLAPWWQSKYYFVYGTTIPLSPTTITILGQPLGADGNLWMVLPDGAERDVTPCVPKCDYCSFTYPTPSKYTPIISWSGGPPITNAQNVVVGQKISLTCGWKDGYGPTISNYSWTVPGYAISNFYISPDPLQTNGYPIPLTIKTNADIGFYWVDGGNKQVSCAIVAEGQSFPANATFNVKMPGGRLRAYISGSVQVYNNRLSFGGLFPGIEFFKENLDTDGEWKLVQLGTQTYRARDFETNGFQWYKAEGNGLDTAYPYPIPEETDTPSTGLDSYIYQVTASGTFTTFLTFKPNLSDAIRVPIRQVNWSWSGAATNNSGVWTGSGSATASANDAPAPSTISWTDNIYRTITDYKPE
jgi:hypothetical protein